MRQTRYWHATPRSHRLFQMPLTPTRVRPGQMYGTPQSRTHRISWTAPKRSPAYGTARTCVCISPARRRRGDVEWHAWIVWTGGDRNMPGMFGVLCMYTRRISFRPERLQTRLGNHVAILSLSIRRPTSIGRIERCHRGLVAETRRRRGAKEARRREEDSILGSNSAGCGHVHTYLPTCYINAGTRVGGEDGCKRALPVGTIFKIFQFVLAR
ncbi:hypothetical protein GGS23DRAFT_50200 [Durotheca rogersii]|uniref:uncharacterized protein n=1 Tax=Durotheca rogersii TaxID=419775 RepID=UPI00221EED93|nr:uncharacterized protein GGS23DRAFT_50200 [Durotheca rogersii]KAI5863044.1 hypothetical protein GGS23DRAFT_50200 [Durotheca rogersii]